MKQRDPVEHRILFGVNMKHHAINIIIIIIIITIIIIMKTKL